LLGLAACASEPGADHESVATSALTANRHLPCTPGSSPCTDLHFVAHEDDDLLFMNPDVRRSIASGNRVFTVYVTAGTRFDEQYLVHRERGILNAYADMVSPSYAVSDIAQYSTMLAHWSLHGGAPIAVSYGGTTRSVVQYDFIEPLPAGAALSVVFLRFPELEDDINDLHGLWYGASSSVATVACATGCPLSSALASQSYTREDLIRVLTGLMVRFQDPLGIAQLSVSTLDSTSLYYASEDFGLDWFDNADHIATGRFATAAFFRYQDVPGTAPRSLRIYRGYNLANEPVNLADAEYQSKYDTFLKYDIFDANANVPPFYDGNQIWSQRKYAVITVAPAAELRGRLATGEGLCLRSDLTLGACASAPEWTLTPRAQIKLGTSCLGLTASNGAQLGSCTYSEATSLVLTSNGQIRARGATCLQADASGGTRAEICQGVLDLAGAPRRAPIMAQNFTLLFSDPILVTTQFSDASEVDDSRSYYRTLTVVDGKVCLRRSGGPGCASYVDAPGETAPLDGSLAAFASWPAQYSDAQGWGDDSTGGTLAFRHLSASGPLDTCGRGYFGMLCGTGASATWWTSEFSTPNGWASSATNYGTIRLADVNGDGNADVCGRGYYGIFCGIGSGTGFSFPSQMTSQYSNDEGWGSSQNAESLQYGDVDGDGRDDVCGRAYAGMLCAVANAAGSSFDNDHVWSFNSSNSAALNSRDFADGDLSADWSLAPARYRSIRLVDINRDGMADVCGRSANGIVCALSTGTAFESKRNVMPFLFTDAQGWNAEQYGSTLSFGNLDSDARVDLCARGIAGMWCSEGY
jgi:hypothetical protein